KSKRGKDALSNLKVYVGIPVELKDSELVTFDEASITRLSSNKYVKLGDVSKRLGSKY
ncbi:50S ribosomal protein L13, partial [Methanosalsum natronophilum]